MTSVYEVKHTFEDNCDKDKGTSFCKQMKYKVLQIRLFWLGKSNFADFVQNSGRLESALFGRDPEFFPSE